MAADLRWSLKARQDLLEIYVAIGRENTVAAERFYDRLKERAEHLNDQPKIGPRRDDIRAGIRMLVVRPYLIFYRIAPDSDGQSVKTIRILRVVDGRRELRGVI